ncbi:MAG: DEAD/DEAH box helicase [Prevotellaceae bacterium]|jgi:superfamily II DNA or RNA helicase|nr:DEAD/DEAH box helicase [Prevotellaceae bacterium]
MNEDFNEYYGSLKSKEKMVINYAALLASFSAYEIKTVVDKHLPGVDSAEITRILQAAASRKIITAARTPEYTVDAAFMVWIYPSLGSLESVVTFIEKNVQIGAYSYVGHHVHRNIRAMLFSLLFGTTAAYLEAEKKFEINGRENMYFDIIGNPRYKSSLKKISPKFLEKVFRKKVTEHIANFLPLDDYTALLKNVDPASASISDLFEHSRFLEHSFRGNIAALNKTYSGDRNLLFKGMFYSLSGKPREAAATFGLAVKNLKSEFKPLYLPLECDLAYHYIVSLLSVDSEISSPIAWQISTMEQSYFRPQSYDVVRPVIFYMLRDGKRKAAAMDVCGRLILDLNITPMVKIHAFLAYGLCKTTPPNQRYCEYMASIIPEVYERGYAMIALEAAYVLKMFYPAEGDEIFERISGELGRQPVIAGIPDTADWEKTLDLLISFCPKEKPAVKEEPATRIAYFYDHEKKSVNPMLQVRNGYQKWSGGRRVSMRNYIEGKISAMSYADRLIASTVVETRGYYRFPGKSMLALVGHPLIFLEGTRSTSIEFVAARPRVNVGKSAKGQYVISSETISSGEIESDVVVVKETNTRYRVMELTEAQRRIVDVIQSEGKIEVPETGIRKLTTLLGFMNVEGMEVHSDLSLSGEHDPNIFNIEPDSRIRVQLLPFNNGLRTELFCKPFGAHPPYCKPGGGGRVLIHAHNDMNLQVKRNFSQELEYETRLMKEIRLLKSIREREDGMIAFENPLDSLNLLEIVNRHLDICVVEWPEGERFRIRASAGFSGLSMEIKSEINWFELTGKLTVDENTVISMMELLAMIDKGHDRFVELSAGEFLSLSEELKKYLDDLRAFGIYDKNGIRINKFASMAMQEMFARIEDLKADQTWREFTDRVRNSTPTEIPVPAGLQTELRQYQLEGFRWMARLAEWDAGACLADDMGLGKTVQTLAMLLHRAEKGAALVVSPVSVTNNWISEAARFAPSLRMKTLPATNREQTIAELQAGDVLVVSYGLLQSEEQLLAGIDFGTVVLDEAHTIKNFATKTSKATMSLRASFRLALTGTPIQNRLSEIWNIFNFLNPGLLGTLDRFGNRFIKPDDDSTRERLRRLLAPFILRRLKSKVLEELPPKTEIVKKITFSDDERAFYEALRRRAVESISKTDKAPMQIFAEITRLRQACCNPALVDAAASSIESSKLVSFLKLADELMENNHRALVFSQFVSHLTLVREALEAKGNQCLYLDGSTPRLEREKTVAAFQSGKGSLFLISLKAGGLGLNLTAADYVIHLDPWWNPAIEDQASDRAHRFGQTRPVTIYRLVAENTIEEKIIRLHETKRDLAESLLEGTDKSASLSVDELIDLIVNA